MARPLRHWYPGAIVHAIARGNEGQPIFKDDEDRRRFLNRLEDLKKIHDFLVYAFVLMTNHLHLLLATKATSISRTMHQLQTAYAVYFNEKYERDGHLFQGRFFSNTVESERYMLESTRYIHRNPPKAGMVRRCADYPWSSHLDYLGLRRMSLVDTGPILAMLSSDPATARQKFLELFDEPESAAEQSAGLDDFLPTESASDMGGEIVLLPAAPTMEEFYAARRPYLGVSLDAIRSGSRARAVSKGRMEFILHAVRTGFRTIDIARFLGCTEQAVAMAVARSRVS